jgi:hypothetical protein
MHILSYSKADFCISGVSTYFSTLPHVYCFWISGRCANEKICILRLQLYCQIVPTFLVSLIFLTSWLLFQDWNNSAKEWAADCNLWTITNWHEIQEVASYFSTAESGGKVHYACLYMYICQVKVRWATGPWLEGSDVAPENLMEW